MSTVAKAHDNSERIKHAKHETRREKHASKIIMQDEKKKAHDIMKDAQFIMKESHTKWRSHQSRVDLMMFFQKNEHQLEKNNH